MYTNNTLVSAAASLSIFSGSANNIDSADGSFAEIFGSRLKGSSGSNSGLEALMNRISSRFPNANVNVTNNGKTEASKESETEKDVSETEKNDSVNVDSSLLSAMANNGDLFKKVEDAISAFLDSAAGTNAMSGAYTQRSVTISITVVTYQTSQRDSSTDDLLSSQDLQTEYQDVLKEKLQELINKIFGTSGITGSESATDEETSESSAIDSTTEAAKTTKPAESNPWQSGFSKYASFSMSLYYSNSIIQSMGNNSGQSTSANASLQSLMFSASYQSSTMGSFQDFANFNLPQSIFGQLGQGNTLSGSFASMFEGSLGQMGLTSGGFSQTTDGFQFNMRNGRDFLSEYLEMAGWGKTPAIKETEAEETVEVADEAIAGAGEES